MQTPAVAVNRTAAAGVALLPCVESRRVDFSPPYHQTGLMKRGTGTATNSACALA